MENNSHKTAAELIAEHAGTPQLVNHHCNLILAGNLVAKPEVRYRANPMLPVTDITVATHNRWFDKKSQTYKDWTTFHKVHIEGESVEKELLNCDKGQLVYIQGNLQTSKDGKQDYIVGDYIQVMGKGTVQSINRIFCTAELSSTIKLVTTEQGGQLAHFTVSLHQNNKVITRQVNLWGKTASQIAQMAKVGQQLIIEGGLNYQKDKKQLQLIDAKQVILGQITTSHQQFQPNP
jgi:single-stranded DNA-binding protein